MIYELSDGAEEREEMRFGFIRLLSAWPEASVGPYLHQHQPYFPTAHAEQFAVLDD